MSHSPTEQERPGPDDPRRPMPIRYLGPDATGLIRAMRLYYEVGRAYGDGCRSLREVALRLEASPGGDEASDNLPCSLASVQRACARVEEFFQRHLELAARPQLLIRTGIGMAFAGLTELGWDAWRLIEAFLRSLGVLIETT